MSCGRGAAGSWLQVARHVPGRSTPTSSASPSAAAAVAVLPTPGPRRRIAAAPKERVGRGSAGRRCVPSGAGTPLHAMRTCNTVSTAVQAGGRPHRTTMGADGQRQRQRRLGHNWEGLLSAPACRRRDCRYQPYALRYRDDSAGAWAADWGGTLCNSIKPACGGQAPQAPRPARTVRSRRGLAYEGRCMEGWRTGALSTNKGPPRWSA